MDVEEETDRGELEMLETDSQSIFGDDFSELLKTDLPGKSGKQQHFSIYFCIATIYSSDLIKGVE